ncbi:hypothetical protein QL285_068608 [Trifolium repens]|nr:hypothetical protein QL285_068608 [Trifolium repens]
MKGCSEVSFNNNPGHMTIIKRAPHSLQSTTPSSNVPLSVWVEWLYCLSEIDISYCGLLQLPDAIGCLRHLQSLNLEGNYFVSLLSLNLNEFSKLVYLNLNHCKFLESLPQLPFPTAINWDLYRYHSKVGLNIFNCPKLGERECRIAFSWLKQFIQANPQCPHDVIDIVIPGSEIPSWFNNQSKGGRILINNSPIIHDINNDIIGFVCCSVFSVKPSTTSHRENKLWIELRTDGPVVKFWLDHRNCLPVFYKGRDLIEVETNHIWLIYFPRKLSWYVPDFHGTMDVEFDYSYGRENYEVKNCGYGWLHKQDLQEFNLTTMHPGNSSTLKRKFLAKEDEAQQQPQLHSFI